MTSTRARPPSYRWTVLSAGVVAQAAYSAMLLGLAAIAPEIRDGFGLTLTQVGVVLAAPFAGALVTLLPWGLVADLIGERVVIGVGLAACAGALVWAAYASSFATLAAALVVAGGLGAGVNSASGRAVMAWFGPEERGLALGIRQTATPLGGAVGAVALPLLDEHLSLRAAFLGLAVGCFVAAFVAAALIRLETSEDPSSSLGPCGTRASGGSASAARSTSCRNWACSGSSSSSCTITAGSRRGRRPRLSP